MKKLQSRTQDLKDLNKSQDETKQALLNVMEDLAAAKDVIELEKAKDEAMFASIGEGLIAVDNTRKITVINKAVENMFGWKAEELVGKVINILPLEDEEGHIVPLNSRPTNVALASGKLTYVSYIFVKKNKTKLPIAITVTPIKLGTKIIGAIVMIRDITQEKEIDKAKSEFVSLASHQLRTPLGITKWYLEVLEHEEYIQKAPEKVQKYFGEIRKSNERILCLVRYLLSVSRIEQGQVKNTPKLVDPTQIVNEVVEQMQVMARPKKIALNLHIQDQKIPAINIDVLRFHEVLENLISNAIEYTLASGKVDVFVDEDNGQLINQC